MITASIILFVITHLLFVTAATVNYQGVKND